MAQQQQRYTQAAQADYGVSGKMIAALIVVPAIGVIAGVWWVLRITSPQSPPTAALAIPTTMGAPNLAKPMNQTPTIQPPADGSELRLSRDFRHCRRSVRRKRRSGSGTWLRRLHHHPPKDSTERHCLQNKS